MADALPRYSSRALPAQRYLPGRTPRSSEPAGALTPFDPARGWKCESFLYGVDLWNRRFFWEAHEAWEAPWRAIGRDAAVGRLLHGLILLAAAAVKHEVGVPAAARRLAVRGARKLQESGPVSAFDRAGFAAELEAWVRGEAATPPLLRLDLAALRTEDD